MIRPVWHLITPDPCSSREVADRLSIAAAETAIRGSPFEWVRWGLLWKTRSHPMLPCDLLAGSRPHGDGWWPNLMLAAGHRGTERYWQFDTYQGENRHIPVDLMPEAINTMTRAYTISAESALWKLNSAALATEIVWENTVYDGRRPQGVDAHRVGEELESFLDANPGLDFGHYSKRDVCDVAWKLSANAAEWSRVLSAPVALESGDNGMVLHVRDEGVGVEAALGLPPMEAFESGATSALPIPVGRGRGLPHLRKLTEGGGVVLMETGDVSVMCTNGRIVSSSKSACYVKGVAVSFFFDPTV